MNEKKNINLPILCALLLIIITGAVGYLYYRVFFQMPRDITFCVASNETLSYQLFDNQFSHILTTITILIAMFGLAIPLATYFFQQKNLEYEWQKIKDEISEFKKVEEVSYDDMTIIEAMPISKKIIRIKFKDGKIIDFNCWDEIRKPYNRKMFNEMIENPDLIYEMQIDDMGTCIYWNDKMDFMNDYLYESDL